ncbi:hypothetical protein B0H94_1023 [Salsuginibacillus halophilus]|uniref:CXXC-20-CXXC protein n=1 Tax=Salsuginibacillus halophilus TaxID=517424 RepID=A0A2P8HWV8_9BACI|nr:hypothetical protein B0H94_1023 [Salsuginibacillus halophilus]
MTNCANCNRKWRIREVWALGFTHKGKNCAHCGKRQYISADTQNLLTLGYLSLVFVVVLPFLVKLSNENERLV